MIDRYCDFCQSHHGDIHAEFTFSLINLPTNLLMILMIDDLNIAGRRSVTNDAEYVLWKIIKDKPFLSLIGKKIIYSDSTKTIDQIYFDKNGHIKFRALGAKTIEQAITKLLENQLAFEKLMDNQS